MEEATDTDEMCVVASEDARAPVVAADVAPWTALSQSRSPARTSEAEDSAEDASHVCVVVVVG